MTGNIAIKGWFTSHNVKFNGGVYPDDQYYMALKDEELYDQIRAAAKRKDYEAGYLDAAAAALGLDKFGYEYKIGGDLDDTTGQVTLTQRVTLTEGQN